VAVLASSETCKIQAFRYGKHAYGLQFHVEINDETVSEWGAIAYATSLKQMLGTGAVASLDRQVAEKLPAFDRDARLQYNNFIPQFEADWQERQKELVRWLMKVETF
jgi:GMP synthase-like glutamine amidotransferase